VKNHPWDLARQPRKNKGITVLLDAAKEAKQTLEFFLLITFWFVEDALSFRDIY